MNIKTTPSKSKGATSLYVKKVQKQLNKTLQGFVEIGNILNQAHTNLNKASFLKMINEDLPFTRRTAQKLMAIANDKRITNPDYMPLLPPHWTSLHQLTYLDDEQFEYGIKEKIIYPDAERKDIIALKTASVKKQKVIDKTKQPKAKKKPLNSQPIFDPKQQLAINFTNSVVSQSLEVEQNVLLAELRNTDKFSEKNSAVFIDELNILCERFGVDIRLSRTTNHKYILENVRKEIKQKKLDFDYELKRYREGEELGDPIQLIKDAFFQLETKTKFDPEPDGSYKPSDLRHPDNPYRDFDLRQLYGYCLDLQLCTQYTPIEFLDAYAFTVVLGEHALTGNIKQQEFALDKLESLSKHWSPAKKLLEQILE